MGPRFSRAGAGLATLALVTGCGPTAPPHAAPPLQRSAPAAAPSAAPPSASAPLPSAPLAPAPAASLPQGASAAPQGPAPLIRAQLAWGGGAHQLARVLQGEQNPEGPMALDADSAGRVWILDQVNQRLVRIDRQGGWHAIPASRTAQELAVDGPGQLWLLDRLVARQVQRLDAETGAVLQTVSLAGPADEPWLITALQVDAGVLWAEYEHSALRPLGGPGLAPLDGRPTGDRRWLLKALRVPPDRAVLAGRSPGAAADEAPGLTIQVAFAWPVQQLIEIGGQRGDRLWLVADLVELAGDGAPLQRRREALLFDDAGRELRRHGLCAGDGPEEQLRSARVGRDGHLYSLCLRDQGAVLEEVAP